MKKQNFNSDSPVISVIMSVYNCSKTLSKSIDSILAQTFKNWELIICDDCSKDETAKIAKAYAERYPNIKFITNKQNKGLAYSLNHCLEYAKGEYIARQDGDDYSLPHRLETQLSFLKDHTRYAIVGSAAILFDENGIWGERRPPEIPTKNDLIKGCTFIHPSVMIRAEAMRIVGGYTVSERTRRCEDYDLWFKLYSLGYRGYNITEPLIMYHEGLDDYKRKSFRARIMEMKTRYIGYRALHVPLWKYVYAFKPLIVGIMPQKFLRSYHHAKYKLQKN